MVRFNRMMEMSSPSMFLRGHGMFRLSKSRDDFLLEVAQLIAIDSYDCKF